MGFFIKASPPICPTNRHCFEWARIYMKYCLCSTKDGVSLGLGAASVISWGVAEVPQIITNYRHKSTEGLSLAFLLTWIVGDLFNLFGCMLEPATLPTQYYMAVLYTITTMVLTSQSIYYAHIYDHLTARRQDLLDGGHFHQPMSVNNETYTDSGGDEKQVNRGDSYRNSFNDVPGAYLHSSPIPVSAPVLPRYGSHGRELYYMSARYLSKGRTPTAGSFLAQEVAHERTIPISIHSPHSVDEPLLDRLVSTHSAPSNTKSMLCVITAGTFFISSIGLHLSMNSRLESIVEKLPQGVVIQVGRKLLQNDTLWLSHGAGGSGGIGTFLGWAMAVIYMGGRLPQICLNFRRGNVEGLNPLMFMFALVGNGTYVASILVNSTEWSKIRANLPWLVDAAGCVLLDTCILFQFVYFCYWKSDDSKVKPRDFDAS